MPAPPMPAESPPYARSPPSRPTWRWPSLVKGNTNAVKATAESLRAATLCGAYRCKECHVLDSHIYSQSVDCFLKAVLAINCVNKILFLILPVQIIPLGIMSFKRHTLHEGRYYNHSAFCRYICIECRQGREFGCEGTVVIVWSAFSSLAW
jgi:hypothetical protein